MAVISMSQRIDGPSRPGMVSTVMGVFALIGINQR